MAEIKIVIGLKNGKSYAKAVNSVPFLGKKIGEKIDGKIIGLPNSEFEITGGSDNAGFPMLKNIPSLRRKKILSGRGVGVRKIEKNGMTRKTVAGREVGDSVAQINLKLIHGDVEKLLAPAVKEEVKQESTE